MRRKTICLVLILAIVISLCVCGCNKDEETVITMFAGLGNNGNNGLYYARLHDMIKQDLGIELRFTYLNSTDTSTGMMYTAEYDDLPADIMVYSNNTPADIQKEAFVNLSEYSDICGEFTYTKIQEATVDGGVYQLPVSSKLIGIAYNKTLLAELGFDVPKTMDDMKKIKAKCDEEGIIFAEGADIATGHGFNLFFNLMGSEWLVSPEGTQWFDDFIEGKADIEPFKEACEYFKEYSEAGLFGKMIPYWDAPGFNYAASERCLFYYCLTSQYTGFTGLQLEDASDPCSVAGAERDADGNIVYTEDAEGNVVIVDGVPRYYNENDSTMKDLTRYSIRGAVILDDVWSSMPWPNSSGDGSFALYDNMLVSINRHLEEPKNKKKLEAALKVLDYLTCKKAEDLFKDFTNAPDGYIAVKDFEIDDSRNYKDFEDEINSGYTMRRAYPYFDNDSIVNTGKEINDYLSGVGDFDRIFDVLWTNHVNYLANKGDSVVSVPETLGYEDNARFEAVCAGLVMQQALTDAGISEEVQAALIPYIDSPLDLQMSKQTAVVQAKIYARDMSEMMFAYTVQPTMNKCIAVEMTGEEINAFLKSGFDIMQDADIKAELKSFENAENYGPYSYALMTKDGIKINNSDTYLVAIPMNSMLASQYSAFSDSGRIITSDGEPVTGNIYNNNIDTFGQCGIALFIKDRNVITKDTVKW